jgi:hypothetical protein
VLSIHILLKLAAISKPNTFSKFDKIGDDKYRQGLTEDDFDGIRAAYETLKGSDGSVSVTKLTQNAHMYLTQ